MYSFQLVVPIGFISFVNIIYAMKSDAEDKTFDLEGIVKGIEYRSRQILATPVEISAELYVMIQDNEGNLCHTLLAAEHMNNDSPENAYLLQLSKVLVIGNKIRVKVEKTGDENLSVYRVLGKYCILDQSAQ